jgi:phenylalanyl-tRNA synthetase alpha chain
VQIRQMEQNSPPLYVATGGRCYRRDTPDATHTAMFTQIEGLAVDEGLSLTHLKGTLLAFARAIFGPEREVRLRPHFFPFTEPSVEVDISCFNCARDGSPCRVCRAEGWVEILGAGMVDPALFDYVVGFDPEVHTGYAWGMGVERVAALRHDIPDIRLLWENDLRFLGQFA